MFEVLPAPPPGLLEFVHCISPGTTAEAGSGVGATKAKKLATSAALSTTPNIRVSFIFIDLYFSSLDRISLHPCAEDINL
jgi:hypothetical protein